METSLRYGGGTKSKTLKLHAKEKFPIDSTTLVQAHAELDTSFGVPSYLALLVRHFFPQSLACLGAGVQYVHRDDISYNIRAKKEFLINSSGHLRFNVKGRWSVDMEFVMQKTRGAAELLWYKFNVQRDQDVMLKVGCEISDKVPYLQIRENNWTFKINANGNWNVRYHM